MRMFVMKCIVGTLVLLGWLLTQTEAIFPVELIRVVFQLPSMLVIDSPSIAWLVLSVLVKVFGTAFYLGLPRNPPRRPIRSDDDPQWTVLFRPPAIEEMVEFLDIIAEWDENQCLARLFCHLQSLPKQNLTFVQNAMLQVLWSSAAPPWNHSVKKSPRRHFVNAAYFAEITQCFDCCRISHPSCTLDTQVLLDIV